MKVKELIESCSQRINYYILEGNYSGRLTTVAKSEVIRKCGKLKVDDFNITVDSEIGVVFLINYFEEEL